MHVLVGSVAEHVDVRHERTLRNLRTHVDVGCERDEADSRRPNRVPSRIDCLARSADRTRRPTRLRRRAAVRRSLRSPIAGALLERFGVAKDRISLVAAENDIRPRPASE